MNDRQESEKKLGKTKVRCSESKDPKKVKKENKNVFKKGRKKRKK